MYFDRHCLPFQNYTCDYTTVYDIKLDTTRELHTHTPINVFINRSSGKIIKKTKIKLQLADIWRKVKCRHIHNNS